MSEEVQKKHKKSKKSKHHGSENENEDDPKAADISTEVNSDHKKHKKHKKTKKHSEEEEESVSEVIDAAASPETESKKSKKSKKRKNNDSDREHEELAEVISEVHTANSWEKVDLGDDHRKLKFLKLMGASKHKDEKEQAIKSRELRDNKKVEKDLEEQFTAGITNKLLNSKHQGLGASGRPEAQNTRKTFDEDGEVAVEQKPAEKSQAQPAETYKFNAAAEAKLKFKKMSFVKSSS